jgi:hypothetical protein
MGRANRSIGTFYKLTSEPIMPLGQASWPISVKKVPVTCFSIGPIFDQSLIANLKSLPSILAKVTPG